MFNSRLQKLYLGIEQESTSWGWIAYWAELQSLRGPTESNEEQDEKQGLCGKNPAGRPCGLHIQSFKIKIKKNLSQLFQRSFLHLSQHICYWPPQMTVKQMDLVTVWLRCPRYTEDN